MQTIHSVACKPSIPYKRKNVQTKLTFCKNLQQNITSNIKTCSDTWRAVNKEAVTIRNFLPPQNIKFAIPLLIGHSLVIFEESENWYRGKLKFNTFYKFSESSSVTGIFPKNCVEIVENSRKTEEIVSVIHEFIDIFMKNDSSDNFLTEMENLVDLKRQLNDDSDLENSDDNANCKISQDSLNDGCGMLKHFSSNSLQSKLSAEINSQIDKLSSHLNLPLLIREETTNTIINVDQMSTKTVYNLHSEARAKRKHLSEGTPKKSCKETDTSEFCLSMTVKSFYVTIPDSGYEIFYRIVDRNGFPLTESFICSLNSETSQSLQHLDKFRTCFENLGDQFWASVLNDVDYLNLESFGYYLDIKVYKCVSLDNPIVQRTLRYSGILNLNESLIFNEEIECKVNLNDLSDENSLKDPINTTSSSVYVTLKAINIKSNSMKSTTSLTLPKSIKPDFSSNCIFIQLRQLNLQQTDYKYYRVVLTAIPDAHHKTNSNQQKPAITLGEYAIDFTKNNNSYSAASSIYQIKNSSSNSNGNFQSSNSLGDEIFCLNLDHFKTCPSFSLQFTLQFASKIKPGQSTKFKESISANCSVIDSCTNAVLLADGKYHTVNLGEGYSIDILTHLASTNYTENREKNTFLGTFYGNFQQGRIAQLVRASC